VAVVEDRGSIRAPAKSEQRHGLAVLCEADPDAGQQRRVNSPKILRTTKVSAPYRYAGGTSSAMAKPVWRRTHAVHKPPENSDQAFAPARLDVGDEEDLQAQFVPKLSRPRAPLPA